LEDSLLELKKQNLLKELERLEKSIAPETQAIGPTARNVDMSDMIGIGLSKRNSSLNPARIRAHVLKGTKCTVQYECPVTHLKLHDAIVLSCNNEDDTV
jgi:hypothetical protein